MNIKLGENYAIQGICKLESGYNANTKIGEWLKDHKEFGLIYSYDNLLFYAINNFNDRQQVIGVTTVESTGGYAKFTTKYDGTINVWSDTEQALEEALTNTKEIIIPVTWYNSKVKSPTSSGEYYVTVMSDYLGKTDSLIPRTLYWHSLKDTKEITLFDSYKDKQQYIDDARKNKGYWYEVTYDGELDRNEILRCLSTDILYWAESPKKPRLFDNKED
ncbi:MAG: hypothetical protein J6S67_07400 [Methanobrevibacter sp.]|nr:hypothetical protein [Methanobrevibacter sp.]